MGMCIIFAIGSSLFAGMTSVLAKCGVEKTDSTVATAIRTVVVLAFGAIVFKERLSARAAIGLALIVAGTLVMFL